MSTPHSLTRYLSRAANGATPHPPEVGPLRDPITTALAQARDAADTAQQSWMAGDDPDVVALRISLACMWAQLAQAEEAERLRREVRGVGDAVRVIGRLIDAGGGS